MPMIYINLLAAGFGKRGQPVGDVSKEDSLGTIASGHFGGRKAARK